MTNRINQQTKRVVIVLIVLLVMAGIAWALDFASRKDADAYKVTVTSGDETLANFSLEELQAMEGRRVMMQGQLQEGPTLLDVLDSAGVKDFTSVDVYGMGLRDSGLITLSRDEVTEDVLLDFAVRGTVKLCGPDIAWEDRVRDVERIDVR